MNPLTTLLLLWVWTAVTTATNDYPGAERGPEAPLLNPTGCGSLHCHILSHLPEVIGCCVAPKDRLEALVDFADKLAAECRSSLDSLDICIAQATAELVGDACLCLKSKTLVESLKSDMKNFVMPALSKEVSLDSAYPNTPAGNRIAKIPSKRKENAGNNRYECTDQRLRGVLCSSLQDNMITAGNTPCRDDHYCGSHGKSYTWCYTDYSNWEYCCSGPCGYHDKPYRWCQARSTWEYCGFYPDGQGTKNVLGMDCKSNHQCGKHGYYNYYYWCKYDSAGNWHYCCAPGESCTNGDCYTNDQSTEKEYCTDY